jgi:hypothetical protein
MFSGQNLGETALKNLRPVRLFRFLARLFLQAQAVPPLRTPSLRRIVSSGHSRVKPLWNKFAPTNAVNQRKLWLTNTGLAATPSASDMSTKHPANILINLSTVMLISFKEQE